MINKMDKETLLKIYEKLDSMEKKIILINSKQNTTNKFLSINNVIFFSTSFLSFLSFIILFYFVITNLFNFF